MMTDIPPIIVVEPASEQSKQRAAAIFVRKERQPDINAIKERLKEIRRYARDHHAVLLETMKKTLSGHGNVRVTLARDAREAASFIRDIAGDINLLSINKSNVLVNELRPELKNTGFTTYLRYFNEFEHFEKGTFQKKVEDYWSLPGMHGRGLVESFDVQKTIGPLRSGAYRNYLAILGVNAISAADGSVCFLQHMSNISKDLEQAKKVVLVVSLEKILKDREEALFHTRSMGIFGLESILLDLIPKDSEKFDFDSLPVLQGPGRELHVIILDNGRSALLEDGYSDLFHCIDCRACARQCPIGLHTMFDRGMLYSPKNYLFGFLQGWLPTTVACLHCGRCQVECPVDIDIPTLIWKSQFEHYAQHPRSLKKRMLDDPELLAKLGSWAAPLSNWLTKLAMTKIFMQIFTGVDRSAHLPTFHRQTFRSWFKGGRSDR
jgi:L-lactate utilization protein LutB